jgi:hypothetical protein
MQYACMLYVCVCDVICVRGILSAVILQRIVEETCMHVEYMHVCEEHMICTCSLFHGGCRPDCWNM